MDGQNPTGQVLTVAEAAEYVGVSQKTIYRALDARSLKHACVGRSKCYRIRREWLDAWIDECSVEDEPGSSGLATKQPVRPPKTPRNGPYAGKQTPRRGFLK